MSKCEKCYHAEVCKNYPCEGIPPKRRQELLEKGCKHFKDKDLIVELPCKVGDTVYFYCNIHNRIFDYQIENICISCNEIEYEAFGTGLIDAINFVIPDIGETVFLTRAEAVLKEREN